MHRSSPGRLAFELITADQDSAELPIHGSDGPLPDAIFGDNATRRPTLAETMFVIPMQIDNCPANDELRDMLALVLPPATARSILGSAFPADDLYSTIEKTDGDPFLATAMIRLWHACSNGGPRDHFLSDSLVTAIVLHLSERISADHPAKNTISLPLWRLKRIEEYADAHLHEPIDLSALSHVAGLSVRHLARTFREEVGITPHRWIMDRRLERAEQLLATSDLTLARISDICGFASQSHLTKVFKEKKGLAPLRWRHLHRE